jgi:CHAT domain-containing protein
LELTEKYDYKEKVIEILGSMSITLLLNNDKEGAVALIEKALVIARTLPEPFYGIYCKQLLGGIYLADGDYTKAVTYITESLRYAEDHDLKPDYANYANLIGEAYTQLGDFEKAIDYFERALSALDEVLQSVDLNDRIDYFSTMFHIYGNLIYTNVLAQKPSKAFMYLERSRARYLVEKIGRKMNLVHIPFHGAMEIQLGLEDDEAIMAYSNINTPYPILIAITRDDLRAVVLDKNTFVEETYRPNRDAIQLTSLPTRSVNIVSTNVNRPGTTRYDSAGNLFTQNRLNEKRFEDVISYYRYLLSKPFLTGEEKAASEQIGRELYEFLISPIDNQLKNIDDIQIIPDGILGFVPFETLIDENGRFLVESAITRYTHSLSVSKLINRRMYADDKKPIILFGGAVYHDSGPGSDSVQFSAQETVPLTDREIAIAAELGGENISDIYRRMNLKWKNLPGTLEEVKEIETIIPGAVVYTGAAVEEPLVKQLSDSGELQKYKVVHFSTHGMSMPRFPELSALVLSQPSKPAAGQMNAGEPASEDGYLSMGEIVDLDLEADFVNLSACETGLGKIYAGEGVVGLSQSFLIAGAKGLSVSLWQVADESTKEFMIGMYRLVEEKGLSYAEAIREMKLRFLGRGGTNRGGTDYGERYSNPFFWAPFVYYGE